MSRELYRSKYRFTAAVLSLPVLLATTFLVLTITVSFAPARSATATPCSASASPR